MKKAAPLFYLMAFLVSFSSCELLKPKEEKIDIPEGITLEQLQETRYKYKTESAYKDSYLFQNKNEQAVITLFNVIKYHIRDNSKNVGDNFDYYVMDIGVDNPSKQAFKINAFTKSCYLSNSDSTWKYNHLESVLKIYYLQTDSSGVDTSYMNRFYRDVLAPRDFIRTKLFAFEVPKEDENPLFFHYSLGNQNYSLNVRK